MRRQLAGLALLGSLALAGGAWLGSCSPKGVEKYAEVEREPRLSPDYAGTVIPPNIAPLNFRILEEGRAYFVTIRSAPDPQGRQASGPRVGSDPGHPIHVSSRTGRIRIPIRKWHALLAASRGRDILFDVYVQDADRQWRRFRPVANTVAPEDIDPTLAYRFLKPAYSWWGDMGIYQRNLTNYDTSVVLQSRSFAGGCLNCHSFVGNDPDTMSISLRSATYGSDTLLARGGTVERIGAKWGYTAWHPSGAVAVHSLNRVTQFFHAGGMEVRDVVDLDSALVCYRVASGRATCPGALADKSRLETYPTWAPDGEYLYFCSAPVLWQDHTAVPPANYDKVKYDLHRISYDVATDQWGQAETVLSADETGRSILLPRVSPDGRFLVFCMCRYGCFPVYQPNSDLYLMDLGTRQYRKLAINSEFAESWHSWSSNSRWLAFSSKRQGGRFTRTYFSYIDSAGTAHKPFVLPQHDPACYDSLLETYSVPELVTGPLPARPSRLARAARAQPSVTPTIPITGATPRAAPSEPWQERE
jgi:hypothetical protein